MIYGKNAQGKTNLLEAIWLFTGGHSFRGAKENELINFKSESAEEEIEFFSQNYGQNAKISLCGGKKEILINGIQKSAAALAEKLSAVVFSPDQMTLVKNGPTERRRFLDGAIAKGKLRYASLLSRYNKTLKQRNALLKDVYRHPELEEILSVWDSSLSRLGAGVVWERKNYIKLLNPAAENIHYGISGNKEKLSVSYFSSINYENVENREEFLKSAAGEYFRVLQKSHEEDVRAGSTQSGPHRDDMEITLNSAAARSFGSQGQQRSAVVSLKLAEAQLLNDIFGEQPIIILDDVLSELDLDRQNFLLNRIKNSQVFISCCEASNKEQLKGGKIFNISEGRIESV